MSRRCLIIACSRTKVVQPDLLPAIQRYDGPAFKVVRRYLRAATSDTSELSTCLLDIFILSAEYGLISAERPIALYDRQMTSARAKIVHSQVLSKIEQEMTSATFETVFVSMGKVYLEAIRGIDALLPKETQLIISTGSQGKKLTELKAWLWEEEASVDAPPGSLAHTYPAKSGSHPRPIANQQARPVVLRGQKVELTHDEALALLQEQLTLNPNKALKIRRWYVDVAGQKVSPKWAAKHLFALPVNRFSADEARRVLRGLGFKCYPVEAN